MHSKENKEKKQPENKNKQTKEKINDGKKANAKERS